MKLDSRDIDIEDIEIGIYYHESDYASIKRRIVSIIIDIMVIVMISCIVLIITRLFNDNLNLKSNCFFLVALSFLYLTFLKRSRFRTVGYILMGIKVVNLRGGKPSLYSMFMRVIMLIIGTYDIPKSIDLAKTDLTKQTLRDKFLGHYVVNVKARPIGSGPIVTAANYYGMRRLFKYKKVEKES
ncbi:MAG: RDD family protein [Deltaproteobacteria bacterium]|nr:RDD family protein [Deltaproteobacteria bacterium]